MFFTLGSTRRPTLGSTRRPTLCSTRRPTLGSTRRPTLGSTRRPTLGSTRRCNNFSIPGCNNLQPVSYYNQNISCYKCAVMAQHIYNMKYFGCIVPKNQIFIVMVQKYFLQKSRYISLICQDHNLLKLQR